MGYYPYADFVCAAFEAYGDHFVGVLEELGNCEMKLSGGGADEVGKLMPRLVIDKEASEHIGLPISRDSVNL